MDDNGPVQGPEEWYTLERAERVAARRNQRERDKYPLLALIGDVRVVTAEQVKRSADAWRQRQIDLDREFERQATEYRQRCCEILDAAEIERMDAYCKRVYPPDATYRLEYWRKQLERLSQERREARDEVYE